MAALLLGGITPLPSIEAKGHLLRSDGQAVHWEHGATPHKHFAVVWRLLEPHQGRTHSMFDGRGWYVGTIDELKAQFFPAA